MYVVTFYSYKGGVGRTLALANVAMDLARRGRHVLLVDFDLEAPGLDTFTQFRPRNLTPGVVEYISEYVATHEAPAVSDYCYEVRLPPRPRDDLAPIENSLTSAELTREDIVGEETRQTGRLWVMPAGRRDDSYSKLLQSIDWGLLYAEHNGYLMFEDLKEQWKQAFSPDYVLVDSRTGHTDIGGICTRQLPDTVVLFFFPNEQNLRGLEGVVQDIRDEGNPPRNKRILLHFVMSNVPDLDDEDRILRDRRMEFERRLGFKKALTIHHYNSLALLNQTIFCEERPRSRLAAEYRQITQEIIRQNPSDREGALIFLSRYATERRRGMLSALEAESMLGRIQIEHADDGEIQTHLAFVRMQEGSREEARRTILRAIGKDVRSPSTLVRRAHCRLLLLEDRQGAEEDAMRALQQSSIMEPDAVRAVQMLTESDDRRSLREIAQRGTVRELPAAVRGLIGTRLNRDVADLPIALDILKGVIEDPNVEDRLRKAAREKMSLALIGSGAFHEAIRFLEEAGARDTSDIAIAFNYAISQWAATQQIDDKLFRRVTDLDTEGMSTEGANYAQCLAVAQWAIGNRELADAFLHRAEALADGWEFSCWRYLEVSEETFRSDLQAMNRLFGGEPLKPEFFHQKGVSSEDAMRLH